MSTITDQIKMALGMTGVVSFYGISSLLVWLAGPVYGLSLTAQLLITTLLVLSIPVIIFLFYIRSKRRTERTSEPTQETPKPTEVKAVSVKVSDDLARGAEETVQWLRNSQLGSRRSVEAIYSLPWFLIAGPQQSGKSSLLLSSGLTFHKLPGQSNAELFSLRPTRNCDWRVTDNSVFIDTAGKYQTDSLDQHEWASIAAVLKRYRALRPLDGLLLCVNLASIINSSDTQNEQTALLLRTRLDDLLQRLELRIPIYLIFTHADAIEGYSDFFSDLKGNEEQQVWGASFPLEHTVNAHSLFDSEFQILHDTLIKRRLRRLESVEPQSSHSNIISFPQRFSDLKPRLSSFTSNLFRPNPFSQSPMLRGFYFVGNSPRAVSVDLNRSVTNGNITNSEKLFAHSLFKDVLPADKDIATAFMAGERGVSRLRTALLAASIILLSMLPAGMIISYFKNRNLVNDSIEKGKRLDRIITSAKEREHDKRSSTETLEELEAMDQLRERLSQLSQYRDKGAPLLYKFGLYSGHTIEPSLRTVYFEALEQRFFRPTVMAIETELAKFQESTNDLPTGSAVTETDEKLGRHYDLLKAYLMLSAPEKVEPTFLSNQLAEYWVRSAPPEMRRLSLQQLDFYTVEAKRNDAPFNRASSELALGTCRRLQAYPAVNRYYKRITTEVNSQVNPVSIVAVQPIQSRGILESEYKVAGSFTLIGFREQMAERLRNAAKDISREDWVMASAGCQVQSQNTDTATLQSSLDELYFRDYSDEWRKVIEKTRIREFQTREDAIEVLRSLSSKNSALEVLLQTVIANTDVSSSKQSGIWNWLKSFFTSEDPRFSGRLKELAKEYGPVSSFMGGRDGENAPVSQYRAVLQTLSSRLETVDGEIQRSKELLAEIKRSESAVNNLTATFKETVSGSALSQLLKRPIENLNQMIQGDSASQMERAWREQVLPKARNLESKYPFSSSTEKAVIDDIARFLNPVDGLLSNFYKDHLTGSFSEVDGGLQLKEAPQFQLSPQFVSYIISAWELREALFQTRKQKPEVNYLLTLSPVSGSDISIRIDGNPVLTSGITAEAATLSWPAKSGETGALIRVRAAGREEQQRAFVGQWGLFEMIEAGGGARTSSTTQPLGWNINSTQVRAVLKSGTVNPFQRSLFTKLKAPENPQK
jgi:type VI secretion system protein ImpL